MHVLHSSLLISDKLSTRFGNEVGINLKLSINFSLHVNVFVQKEKKNFLYFFYSIVINFFLYNKTAIKIF